MTEETYSIKEAATILKRHPQTLRRWIREGKLSATRVGKQFGVRREDLEQIAQLSRPQEPEKTNHLDQLTLAAMAELWDNNEDAIYDNWRALYGVVAT
jgi:excisionase family DNA binding protein